jgi:hypothetical protein
MIDKRSSLLWRLCYTIIANIEGLREVLIKDKGLKSYELL